MWKVIQELLPWLLVVLFVSQYVWPVLTNTTTWWLFRPSKKTKPEVKPSEPTLADDIKETKVIADEAKQKVEELKQKVNEHFKTAEELKKESNNLL